jgi:hypothetical protein
VFYALQSLRVCAPCANFLIVLIKDAALGKDILTTKCVMSLRSPTEDENGGISLYPPERQFSKEITKATKGSDILVINFVPFVVIFDFLFWLWLCRARFFAVIFCVLSADPADMLSGAQTKGLLKEPDRL